MSTGPVVTIQDLRDDHAWVLSESFLGHVGGRDLPRLVRSLAWRDHAAGAVLAGPGAPDGVHLVVAGQVALRWGGAGMERVRGPGLLIDSRSDAGTTALTRARTLFLGRGELERLAGDLPALRSYFDQRRRLRRERDRLVERLARNPYFRALGREEVEALLQAGHLDCDLAPGSDVAAGRPADVLVVVRGRLGLRLVPGRPASRGGRSGALAAIVGPGDAVGVEDALLGRAPDFRGVALDESDVLRIPREAFRTAVFRQGGTLERLLQVPSARDLAVDLLRAHPPTRCRVVVVAPSEESPAGVDWTPTLAWGLAAALRREVRVVVVDLDGDRTAASLGRPAVDLPGPVPLRRLPVPGAWDLADVVWPCDRGDLPRLLGDLRAGARTQDRPTVVVVSAPAPSDRVLALADVLVGVRGAGDRAPPLPARRGQVRVHALVLSGGGALPARGWPRCARIPVDRDTRRAFWTQGRFDLLGDPGHPLGAACGRLGRLARGRSVGVALGGGGAFGYSHIALLRELHRAGVPIDFVAGVSFGSLVGAIYAGAGLPGLDRLLDHSAALEATVLAALVSLRPLEFLVDRLAGGRRLETTEIPFLPVGFEVTHGVAYVLARGRLGEGTASASAMPFAFPAKRRGRLRLLDGGVVNNVPASVLWEAGADFIIASNIIPSDPVRARPWYWPERLADGFRGTYFVLSQNGRDRGAVADLLFEPGLDGTGVDEYEFRQGARIVDLAAPAAARAARAAREAWLAGT